MSVPCSIQWFLLAFSNDEFECSLAHCKELINPNEGLVQLNDVFAWLGWTPLGIMAFKLFMWDSLLLIWTFGVGFERSIFSELKRFSLAHWKELINPHIGLSMLNSGMFAQLCWASSGTNRIQLLMLQPLSYCTPKNTLKNSGTRLFVCFSLFISLNSRWQQRKPPSYKSNWLGWFYCTHLCIDNSFNFAMNITLEHGALIFLLLMITNQL